MRHRFTPLIIAIIFLTSCSDYGERLIPLSIIEGKPSGGINQIEVAEINNHTLDLSVSLFAVNHVGSFIDFLEPSDFTINSNYNSSVISDFTCITVENGNDASVGMLFDQSGSINTTDPMDARIQAGIQFTNLLENTDEACVHSFNDDLSEIAGFTNNLNVLEEAIESLAGNATDGTMLYTALLQTTEDVYEMSSNSQKAVIAFTDGNAQDASLRNSVIEYAQDKVPIIIIALNETGAITSQAELTEVALSTNGAYIEAENVTGVISAYSSMAEFLTGSSILNEFNLRLEKEEGENWISGEAVNVNIVVNLPQNHSIRYPLRYIIP